MPQDDLAPKLRPALILRRVLTFSLSVSVIVLFCFLLVIAPGREDDESVLVLLAVAQYVVLLGLALLIATHLYIGRRRRVHGRR